jgi:ABC-type Fe3+-siderophore transport system permease subunit
VAALLGMTVPVVVLLITWGAAEVGASRSPSTFAALLMGSYLVKLVAVIALLAVLDRAELANPVVTGVSAIVGLMAALVVEALVVLRTRAPYVEP